MKRIVNPPPGPIKQATSQDEVDRFYSRRFNLTAFLFDKQLAFVEDPAPFKVAVCSRRSGKTTACAAHLISAAISTPNMNFLYITLTADMVKRNIWKELRKINIKYKLDGVENLANMTFTFPNGSVIYTSGCSDKSEVEKFRGMAIKLCYIDECQSFRAYIEDLIDDVIGPALLDYAGTLCLIGTPGPVPGGFFHTCAVKNEAWSKYHWTFWDNPFIPLTAGMTHDAVFSRELKRQGRTQEDPKIQREFYGKWVLDRNSLLIQYDSTRNHFTSTPDRGMHYIMGIDIGFKDADAICVLAYSDNEPTTYLVEELVTTKQGITELVEQIKEVDKRYKVNKMVMDMGGLGKKIGEEMIRRYQIPVEAADKVRKMENIELMNDALRTGRLLAKSTSRFAQDSYLVEIDKDKSTPESIKVSNRFHSDIIDAVLYAFKCSPAYAYQKPPEKPKYGSKEWAESENDKMWEAELAGHIQAEEDKKWGFDE